MSNTQETCAACRKPFADGDDAVTFYFEKAKIGEKSGILGFYTHPNYPGDYIDRIHFNYACVEKCFSPADNPFMYDVIVNKIRLEVTDDIRQEAYDEINIELEDGFPDIDDPPFCLWCKKREPVWIQIRSNGYIYTCTACQKYWDQDENELDQYGNVAA